MCGHLDRLGPRFIVVQRVVLFRSRRCCDKVEDTVVATITQGYLVHAVCFHLRHGVRGGIFAFGLTRGHECGRQVSESPGHAYPSIQTGLPLYFFYVVACPYAPR